MEMITKKQIKEVKEINSCLEPEHWTKPMYDSFIVGFRLGKSRVEDEASKILKEIKSKLDTIYK